jgi:hypothetical protein
MMKYEHLIYYENKEGKTFLCIDRKFENGRRDFMTHYELPPTQGESEGFDLMARAAEGLGNSVLIDSPAFREHIGIAE